MCSASSGISRRPPAAVTRLPGMIRVQQHKPQPYCSLCTAGRSQRAAPALPPCRPARAGGGYYPAEARSALAAKTQRYPGTWVLASTSDAPVACPTDLPLSAAGINLRRRTQHRTAKLYSSHHKPYGPPRPLTLARSHSPVTHWLGALCYQHSLPKLPDLSTHPHPHAHPRPRTHTTSY